MQKANEEHNMEDSTEEQPFVEKNNVSRLNLKRIFVRFIYIVIDLASIFAFGYLWQFLFMLPYCGLLYQCGCTFLWSGGADHCNAFIPESDYRYPWCVAPKASAWLVTYGTALSMTLFTVLISRLITSRINMLNEYPNYTRKNILWILYHIVLRFVTSVMIFLIYGFILAVAFKYASGYPYFIFYNYPPQNATLSHHHNLHGGHEHHLNH